MNTARSTHSQANAMGEGKPSCGGGVAASQGAGVRLDWDEGQVLASSFRPVLSGASV